MEEKIRQTYLFDFYGELLNEHQRRVYEDFVCNDLSLSEIAAELGISRQGVADLVKRCDQKLMAYENKLHLLEKFLSVKEMVGQIRRLCRQYGAAGCNSGSCSGRESGCAGYMQKNVGFESGFGCGQNADPESRDFTGLMQRIEQISSQILEEL